MAKTKPQINETSPQFEEIKERMIAICQGDKRCLLKFTILKHDGDDTHAHKVYGSYISTAGLIGENLPSTEYKLRDEKGEPTGNTMKFDKFLILEQPSFAEYLKCGWKINLCVAIDYTASNGHPAEPGSLHSDDFARNNYLAAMDSVGQILETYDRGKKFHLFGFGGIPKVSADAPDRGQVSSFFPIKYADE